MKRRDNKISRLVPDSPIFSRYEGICNVCKHAYYPGELISPYFEFGKNYWRHTACLQLFFILFKYRGDCISCDQEIDIFSGGYWSKHNGIWCESCCEKLFPKVVVANSREQKNLTKKIKKYG